ncbi:ADP-ribosylglycohydrolase family protein [Metabacillus sp. RGM 3146]|uniref:ADP-ribosylglycohydrolase family protein n=1 Tax=Metabacillus sp. RGM 3146 TaxID=3401092 RepID=UPI003B9A0AD8
MLDRWDADDRIFLTLRIKKRLFPTLIGGIVGDALGVPVEFEPRGINISGMTGYGTYNQPPGTWSDDTSLTLCLIENLIEEKDEYGLMEKFMEYRNGYWTPYGRMFDIGLATDDAIERYKNGIPLNECGGASVSDNGNGALMRISPLIFTLFHEPDFNKRLQEIERVAEITHAHPRSTMGCILYIQLLFYLFHNYAPLAAFDHTLKTCIQGLSSNEKYKTEFEHYRRIFDRSILDLSINEIKSDGYVVHSLEAAIWCFLIHDNYRQAVLEAVNLGGDTDTIAFITGTLAGMRYKIESIPEEWIDALARKQDIDDLLNRFTEFCGRKAHHQST